MQRVKCDWPWDPHRRRPSHGRDVSYTPECKQVTSRNIETDYSKRADTPEAYQSSPRFLDEDYKRRVKLYDDVVTKIKGIRQPEPRKRLFPSPTFEEIRWLQSDMSGKSRGRFVNETSERGGTTGSENENYGLQAEQSGVYSTRGSVSRNKHHLRYEYSGTPTGEYPHSDNKECVAPIKHEYPDTPNNEYSHGVNEEFVETVKDNLRSARKSIHDFRCQILETETRPASALRQTYTQKTAKIPDWFRELFADGPAIFKLRPTFDTDVAGTSDECRDMMEAEFTIAVSPMDVLDKDCHVFVTERLSFPYTGTLSRHPLDNYLQSQWRKPCDFNVKSTGMFCPKRVSLSGVAEDAVFVHLAGNDSRDLRLRQGRVVRLVFIDDEESGAVKGIYRRQMTTQPYYLTWGLVEDWVDD